MDTENQVVSLGLSRKLKEANYPQEGLWWWVWDRAASYNLYVVKHKDVKLDLMPHMSFECAAPTVAELGEMLPENITIQQQREGYWHILYRDKLRAQDDKIYNNRYDVPANTEANARAKIWLYLKKEKLL